MDNTMNNDNTMTGAGLPYDDINWYDMEGQPFGAASKFNVIVFNDANNIIDVEGPVAIGGSFYSPRGMSVGFVNKVPNYSPDLVRFLVGGNVSMAGPLVVAGHVVVGGRFSAAKGSTYLIGKDGSNNQLQQLKFLYQVSGGSQYWTPTDKGDHYIVPSYDVPRYIPASRIGADIPSFFRDARESIRDYKECIESLTPNGTVMDNGYEWILRGNDPVQNVFLIDARPNGLINKGIRAEVPQGSAVIVRLRTGANAHLQYGVYGEKSKVNQTLYVFEDATNIYMEKSSDIWGSILAPQAMFHAHATGGHVSGNAALGSFAVNANSGFEFHYYPFAGGVTCQAVSPAVPTPVTPIPVVPTPVIPTPVAPTPVVPTPVIPTPIAPTPVVPTPVIPTPVSPAQEECPECPTCPVQRPCPTPEPCPTCPVAPPCPTCPVQRPCPTPEPCPTCPEQRPCPRCPMPEPCPECPIPQTCPDCPEQETVYISVPVPFPVECPEQERCPVCQECLINPGIVAGCIWGCECGKSHCWDVELYERRRNEDILLYCEEINGHGCFEFAVSFEGLYILKVRLSNGCCKTFRCKPIVTLNNIGVEGFMME